MIRDAILYVPDPEDARVALIEVAGWPVVLRAAMAARRAGVAQVSLPVGFRVPDLERAIHLHPSLRSAVQWLEPATARPSAPALLLPVSVVVPPRDLAPLLAQPPITVLAGSRESGAPVFTADVALLATAAEALARGAMLGDEFDRVLKSRRAVVHSGASWWVRVCDPGSAAEAERLLYGTLGSAIDSPLDTAVHRRLSRVMTRWAIARGLAPNTITVASLGVGLGAAWCFWAATAPSAVAGLLLYAGSVVLDHADGEVARLQFRESRFGEWLDVISDTVVHTSVVAGISVTGARAGGAAAAVGAVAVAGVLVSAAVAKTSPPPGSDRGGRVLAALGGRDGFYAMLVAFIVLVGLRPVWLPILMVLVAAGTHGYWVSRLVYLIARRLR